MSDLVAHALPAALFAGVVAVAVTVAVERFGGRVGGLLGTLPTTIVPASLGVLAQTDAAGFREAMDATPAGMLLNAVFLWLWRVLPPRLPAWSLRARLALMSALSLGVWLVLAVGLIAGASRWRAQWSTWSLSLLGLGLLVGLGLWATWRTVPAPRGRRPVRSAILALRGVFAALSIGVAVWIASVWGGLAAGVAAVFPAIFLTTMVALWLAQGEAVQAGAVGPMMLGASSVAGYAVWARWLMPAWGPWGAAVAWPLAVLTTTLPAWAWIRRGRSG